LTVIPQAVLTSFYLGTGSKHPASTDHVQADYAYGN
jgi:hypothetical protein